MCGNINGDRVVLFNEANRSAERRFWCNVRDHESVRCAREATVGDQRDLIAKPLANECGGDGEHLAHPWSANGTFVANHHHVARLDAVRANRREGGLFTIEDARGTAVMPA